jgi:hypothetical protein
MKSIGEQWNQITKHVARARETVQQHQFWRAGCTCFAIENLEPIDVGRAISGRHHEKPPLFVTSPMGIQDGG